MSGTVETSGTAIEAPPPSSGRGEGIAQRLALSIGPVILTLIGCGVLLAVINRDPIAFYRDILQGGLLRASGLQDSITRMAPVLLMAAGLIVAFRASLWNLGADGQYLLSAAMVAGIAPTLLTMVPAPIGWVVLGLVAMAIGAAWTLVPSLLKARYGLNEIVTTLMMTFIGINLAVVLVSGPFDGPVAVPQTAVLPPETMLPDIPGTTIHIGFVVALVACLTTYLVFARTPFGMRLDVMGTNARAAVHLGINVPRLIVMAFLISGGLIGLAAAMDIQGIFGYMRADWDPAYGLAVVPLVFLARMNALALIPFAALFSLLSIGGLYAARRAAIPSDFVLLFMGILLLFMVGTQYLSDKRARGEPLLPARLRPSVAHG